MKAEGLLARAYGHWPHIMRALAPNKYLLDSIALFEQYPDAKPAKWATSCPLHGGLSKKAFHVYPQFPKAGWSFCNSCQSVSGYEMLMKLNGWSVKRAGQELGKYLDGEPHSAPSLIRPVMVAPPPADKPGGTPRKELALWWSEGVLFNDPLALPARLFYQSRQLETIPVLPTLRVHPGLQWTKKKSQRYPTLLGKFVDASGRGVGLQRLFLTADGRKAPIPDPRMSVKVEGETLVGSAVKLFEAGPILGIAEGIETALAVYLATGMPMWATTTTSLMRTLVIPDYVRRVVIWADYDEITVLPDGRIIEPGRDAAEALAARLRAEHRDVIILPANVLGRRGVDWNDVWTEGGAALFPTLQFKGWLSKCLGLV